MNSNLSQKKLHPFEKNIKKPENVPEKRVHNHQKHGMTISSLMMLIGPCNLPQKNYEKSKKFLIMHKLYPRLLTIKLLMSEKKLRFV